MSSLACSRLSPIETVFSTNCEPVLSGFSGHCHGKNCVHTVSFGVT